MNAPQHLHRSSAMATTVGHIQANSWASCYFRSTTVFSLQAIEGLLPLDPLTVKRRPFSMVALVGPTMDEISGKTAL